MFWGLWFWVLGGPSGRVGAAQEREVRIREENGLGEFGNYVGNVG